MTEPAGADQVAPAQRDDRTRWALVAGTSLITVALAAYEIGPASVTPLIRESLGIGATSAGLVVGVMFGIAMVLSLPAGVLLDRADSRRAMAGAVLGLVLAGVWGWRAASRGEFYSLLASRLVGGAVFVVAWNAGIDIVSEAADDDRRATLVAVYTASGSLGFAAGQGLGPLIAETWGWPAIFVVYNGIALVGLTLFWPSSRGLGGAADEAPGITQIGSVFRNRPVWLVGGLGFLGYGLFLFVNSWGPSYLTEEVGLSLAASGLVVALFPAVGVVGRIGGGVISDRLFDGRRRPVLLVSFAAATPLLAAFTWLSSVPTIVATLLIAGLAIQLMIGLAFAYVRELVDRSVAATGVAFLTAIGLAGAFVSPIAGGAVIDATGYPTAFLAAGALAAVGVLLAWRAPETG